MDHSFEFYAQLVNFFLYKRTDESGRILHENKQPAVRLLPLLDTTTLEEVPTFGSVATVKILQLVQRYFNQYHTTPSKVVYEDLKQNDPSFRDWWTSRATDAQRSDVDRMDLYLYEPVEDEQYLEQIIFDLAIQIELKKHMRNLNAALTQKGNAQQAALDHIEAMAGLREKIEVTGRTDQGQHRYIYGTQKRATDYQTISGVKSQFELIELRPNGIMGLFGAPKDGKTRITIAVARYWAAKGYDVMYMDLENGDKEMEARFLQAELTKWKGSPVPMNFFYCGIFIHEDRIECEPWTPNDPSVMPEDLRYKIQYWTEPVTNKDGTEREQMFAEVAVYKSKVVAPTLDPETDAAEGGPESDWEFVEVLEDDRGTDCQLCIHEDLQNVLDRAVPEISEGVKGQVRVEYIPAAHISQMRSTLNRVMDDPRDDFFSRPGWRILIVDWMQLLQNNAGKIWERTRENYGTLKEWQAKDQMYVMVVDGVKDPSQLKKLYPDLEKAGTVGTSQTDYNVASSVLFCVSDEEKANNAARLVAKRTRYGASGSHVQECLLTDPAFAVIDPIEREEHVALCPELWEEKPDATRKGNKKKKDNMFDGIDLE